MPWQGTLTDEELALIGRYISVERLVCAQFRVSPHPQLLALWEKLRCYAAPTQPDISVKEVRQTQMAGDVYYCLHGIGHGRAVARGCCYRCYGFYRNLVRTHGQTWDGLEQQGKVLAAWRPQIRRRPPTLERAEQNAR